jgi:hypothetical protein
LAVYRSAGQKRPSKALVLSNVADPQAELSRLLSSEIVEFRVVDGAVAAKPTDVDPVRRPDDVDWFFERVQQRVATTSREDMLRVMAQATLKARSLTAGWKVLHVKMMTTAGLRMVGQSNVL